MNWLSEARFRPPGRRSAWSKDAISKVNFTQRGCCGDTFADNPTGAAQATVSGIDETLETFASLMPWLSGGKLGSSNAQFLSWTETLLCKGAIMASEEARNTSPYSDPRHVEIALRLFRLWAALPAVKQGLTAPTPSHLDASTSLSRTSIWKAYYGFLTTVLQHELAYVAPNDGPDRPQLASELRRIEAICENNLLREVKFPTASSNNSEVEEWVEQVISNWEVLCGPHWQDQDLGEGGQNTVGRNVLDVSATQVIHLRSYADKPPQLLDTVSCSNKNLSFPPDFTASVSCSLRLGGL